MNAAISIQNVSVTLSGRVKALENINVDLPEGKIIGFIGPSGAGKTTLLRSIVGRQRLTAGTLAVFGVPAGSPQLRQQISYMTQELSVYADLTVLENLRYFATMIGVSKKDRPILLQTVLETLDMTSQADRLVKHLSGGQKSRVSLGVALLGSPKLLVLDEPTVGLDPVLRERLWHLFRNLVEQGKTIIVSSHVMEEAERCDELLLIRDRSVLAYGSPKELCERTHTKTVEQSFLQLVGGVPA